MAIQDRPAGTRPDPTMGWVLLDLIKNRVGYGFKTKNPKRVQVSSKPDPNPTWLHIKLLNYPYIYIVINNPNSFHFSSYSPILISELPPTFSQISNHSHGLSHSDTATASPLPPPPPSTSQAVTLTNSHSHSRPHCLTVAPLNRSHSPSSLCLQYVLFFFFFFFFFAIPVWVH